MMDGGKYGGLDVDHVLSKMDPNVFDELGPPVDQYGGGIDHYGEHMDQNADNVAPDMYSYLNGMDEEELMRRYQQYYEEEGGEYYPEDRGYYGDGEEYYGNDENYPGYYDDEYTRISISELSDRCIIPTLGQAFHTVYPLLALCLFSRLVVMFCSDCKQLGKCVWRLMK